MSRRSHLVAAGAAAATAVVGGLGTDVRSAWYHDLRKPPFQPPGPAFGGAWTVLYVLIALSGGRALDRVRPADRRAYLGALALNLALNAGWCWAFFRLRSPGLATTEILALQASNVDLARRTLRVDRPAAVLLTPYLVWVGFASVLSGEILRRNR